MLNSDNSKQPDAEQQTTAIALTIAGSDSGGGAGIQADLKTFSALGVYGASVITAVTAQNTQAVTAVHDIPVDIVTKQIQAVLDDINVAAIKVGMLSSSEIILAVSEQLSQSNIPVVLDPVMVSKSGDALLQQSAIESLKTKLLPIAFLLTPNLPEAATLLQCGVANNETAMQAQGEALIKLGAKAVLMKGGHAKGDECVDLLIVRDGPITRFQSARINTKNTHGTGCTLSSAIAAHLAKGISLVESVHLSHNYLKQAIVSADQLQIGKGYGPVHHFHSLWQ
ncbi:MAG: hydroxymethylpyrimidine/phosphomethylpyrimidine kinase [Candidatus Azotimanducaceae bacterium]